MCKHTLTIAAALGLVASVAAGAQQPRPAKTPSLAPQDYIEIQQLSARYAFDIDTCVNAGADFADLFTDDGEFSVSQQWGVAGNRRTKGRTALIDAAGGDGQGGCKDPKTTMGYGISHIVVNHVITPTPDGATGKSYILAIGVGGDPTKIERQGGYDDVYVKTPAGWRIKSRIHVFPNMAESVQFGGRGRRGQAGGAQGQPGSSPTPAPPASPQQPGR
jgi:SnoaL-like domain